MNIAVVCALDKEIDLIRSQLSNVVFHDGVFAVTEGTAHSHRLFVAISGIGKSLSAAATQHLIDAFDCKAVINIGLAGGAEKHRKKGDVVIAQRLKFHDFDLHISDSFASYFDGFATDSHLSKLAVKACNTLGFGFEQGTVATGDVFVNDKSLKDDITARTGCACVEMEGASIAFVAATNSLPFASIKIISDSADEDADADFASSIELFAGKTSAIVLEMVKDM